MNDSIIIELADQKIDFDNDLVYMAYYFGDLAGVTDNDSSVSVPEPEVFEGIASYIQTMVAPKTWDEERSIKPYQTSHTVIIRQTRPIHAQIANLLNDLRRYRDDQP